MIELKLPDVPVPDHLQVELSGAGCLDSQEPDVVRRVGSHSHGLEVEAVPDRGLGLHRLQRHDTDLVSDPIVSVSFSRFRPTPKKFSYLKTFQLYEIGYGLEVKRFNSLSHTHSMYCKKT